MKKIMNIQEIEAWRNLEDSTLRDIKIRPISLLSGILFGHFGIIDNKIQSLENIAFSFSFPLLPLMSIIYTDNKVSGRNHEDALYNANICALNYSFGYALGFVIKGLLGL